MRYPILLAIVFIAMLLGSMAYATTVPSLEIVVYKDGKALADATVELWLNNTLKHRGVTDANGTITLANITTGNYTIYVYYNGSVWKFDEEIDINTSSITLNITTSNTDDTTGDDNTTGAWIAYLSNNKMLMYTGIGVLLVILLLLAYAYSGKKIPHRR